MQSDAEARGHASAGDEGWMQHAFALADRAEREFDEVPVGAVIVSAEGRLIGEGFNQTISLKDPSAHAEIIAMRQAGQAITNYRILDATLYVSLEPCAMCCMAMIHARIKRVVYAASDPKTGALGGLFDLNAQYKHNHVLQVQGGLLAEPASRRLSAYFQRKRQQR